MEHYPLLARRFLIRTFIVRYKKMLDKAKISYKLSDTKYEELCEKFLNPAYVDNILIKLVGVGASVLFG